MNQKRGALACLLLGLVGLGLAGYLVVPHLGLLRGELIGGAACGGGPAFNCHLVTGSAWGSFLGVPLALWGTVGYVAVIALALLARQSAEWASQALTLLVLLATACVAIDLLLLGVMAFVIRSFCALCLATYAVNLALLVVATRALRRPWSESVRGVGTALSALVPSGQRPAAWLFWGMMGIGVLGSASLHAATVFLSRGTLGSQREQMRQFVAQQSRVQVEIAGDPILGSPQAPLVIIEFSDFRCPVCQRAAKLNPIVLANHRREAAFIFKHFPLDITCNTTIPHQLHPGACQLAAAAECAHLQGKFWELHDRIFEQGKDYPLAQLEADVRRLGLDVRRFETCMASGQGLEAVKRDIAQAGGMGIKSTPTYVVNGVMASGVLAPSVFEELIAAIREGT